ncbi:hypothetical protein [Methanomethylovorans sp.]|uniref:hypothetical protein n=1 Tax=Methanomethylovorans sp. TaxID=2758717 RepID=UPI000B007C1C|nr:hypothetical protein [Methanomethylovorans sp.]
MESNSDILELFDSILSDELEKKLMRFILNEKKHEEIVEEILQLNESGGIA